LFVDIAFHRNIHSEWNAESCSMKRVGICMRLANEAQLECSKQLIGELDSEYIGCDVDDMKQRVIRYRLEAII